MTKVTMPEPVGYQWLDTGHFRKKVPADADASAFRALITTTQAEAYAEARVREALEEAANVTLDAPITAGMEANEGALALSIHANSRIRALIHTTK